MDLRSGHPYWLLRNGLPTAFPTLNKDIKCDVLVIGAGITGALVAFHLAEAGFSTVIADKREAAWGSTAASTALLQYEIDTPLCELIGKLGQSHAVRAYLACRDAIGKLDALTRRLPDNCGFSLRRSLQVAPEDKALETLRREYGTRLQYGFDMEWWGPDDLRRQMGFERPGAIFSRDGAQVDPYRLTWQLLMQGKKLGLHVFDRTPVTEYDFTPAGVSARTDKGRTILAKHVVFATGYEATELLERRIVDLNSSFALVSEPLTGPLWQDECLVWEHADPYLYFRTTEDRRVIIGGEDEPFRNPEKRDALIPAKTKILLEKFAAYFPHLPVEVAFAWAGTFGETHDGLAYIGQVPEFPSAFFTLGFGGNGITYSILAAEMIRDSLHGIRSPYEGLFGFNR
ncbi:MAG: FAD-dependent oxidoreductase [Verrucomicrobiota bacterium]